MPKFRVCDRLISFDYPASLSECAERMLSLAAKIKILERTGQKEAAILADCELAMLQEWQKSSYLLTMMSVRNCQSVSESKLKEEGELVRQLQSVLLRLQFNGVDISEEGKVVCQYAREWLASKGCQEIPPEYLIPDKFKIQDSESTVQESKLVMDVVNGKSSLTQLGKALQSKLNPENKTSSSVDLNVSKQMETLDKNIQDVATRLYDLESISLQALKDFKSNIDLVNKTNEERVDEKLSLATEELKKVNQRIDELENIEFERIESILTTDQIKELISNSIINKGVEAKGSEDTSRLNKILKKYEDEIKAISASRKDRLSKLEKKVEYLSGFAEVERNIRMAQHKATSTNIKILKQACQVVTQGLGDKNNTQQIEILLSSVGYLNNSNFVNNSNSTKSPFVAV